MHLLCRVCVRAGNCYLFWRERARQDRKACWLSSSNSPLLPRYERPFFSSASAGVCVFLSRLFWAPVYSLQRPLRHAGSFPPPSRHFSQGMKHSSSAAATAVCGCFGPVFSGRQSTAYISLPIITHQPRGNTVQAEDFIFFFIPIILNVDLSTVQLSVQFLDTPAGVTQKKRKKSHTLLSSRIFLLYLPPSRRSCCVPLVVGFVAPRLAVGSHFWEADGVKPGFHTHWSAHVL